MSSRNTQTSSSVSAALPIYDLKNITTILYNGIIKLQFIIIPILCILSVILLFFKHLNFLAKIIALISLFLFFFMLPIDKIKDKLYNNNNTLSLINLIDPFIIFVFGCVCYIVLEISSFFILILSPHHYYDMNLYNLLYLFSSMIYFGIIIMLYNCTDYTYTKLFFLISILIMAICQILIAKNVFKTKDRRHTNG